MRTKQIKKERGIAIITSYAVLIILIILSAAFMSRVLTWGRLSAKERDFRLALKFAEEGVACAIQELQQNGYQWWTHVRNLQVLNPITFPGCSVPGTVQNGNDYAAADGRFRVRTYQDLWFSAGTIILSRGTSGDAQRVLAVKIINSGGIVVWVEVNSFDLPPTI